MGGCTSKPKEFDSQAAPLPAETPSSPKDAKGETVPQENNNGGEAKKEEPLVDLSEPIPEAPEVETSTETKTAEVAVVYNESKPTETSEVVSKPTEEKVEAKEVAKEEKKEVVEVVEDKNDAPLVEI